MGEGNHTSAAGSAWSERFKSAGKNKVALIVAGLAVAFLMAGIVIQMFRAEPTAAGEGPGKSRSTKAGTARVSGSRPMAKVGSQMIDYDDVAAECVQRIGTEVLDNMINRIIIQQACLKRGITVSGDEVSQEIQKIAKKFNLDVKNWYQMLQAERELTPLQYQRDVIWPMLALRKVAGENVVITNEDRRKFYESEYGPRVKAKMIMLGKLGHAQKVWEKAQRNRDDFGRLAREHSIEPTSRSLDGAIPPIRMHVGAEEVVKAAFKLKLGEISGIIQAGPSRYVILLCEGETSPVAEYEEVREIIEEQLLEQKRQEAVAKVFTQLKKEIRVDNYLNRTSTGGIRQTSDTRNLAERNAAGLNKQPIRR